MSAKILCLIAGQRAGTTALHTALRSCGTFENFGEIFHDAELSDGAYLTFCQQQELKVEDIATYDGAATWARRYLGWLAERAEGRVPLIDVKLNSWHAMQPFWTYVHDRPFFMNQLLETDTTFLMIRRVDLVAQVLSEQIARAADKWHDLLEEDIPEEIEVDLALATWQARVISQAETLLFANLKGALRTICVTYENLYPDGTVNPQVVDLLADRFDPALRSPLEPGISRNAGDKQRIVRNYREVKAAIEDVMRQYPRPDIPDVGVI